MSGGFPWKRPSSSIFFVPIPIPFGNGKLAQEGSALARKRNPINFLASSPWLAGTAFILQCNSALDQKEPARPKVEVPLDGAETKSEDYQMDGGTCALLKAQRSP